MNSKCLKRVSVTKKNCRPKGPSQEHDVHESNSEYSNIEALDR